MVIDLVKSEIFHLDGPLDTKDNFYGEREYNLYCSKVFYNRVLEELKELFSRTAFITYRSDCEDSQKLNELLPNQKCMVDYLEMAPMSVYFPLIGKINFIIDIPQGYRIERLQNDIKTKPVFTGNGS